MTESVSKGLWQIDRASNRSAGRQLALFFSPEFHGPEPLVQPEIGAMPLGQGFEPFHPHRGLVEAAIQPGFPSPIEDSQVQRAAQHRPLGAHTL